MQFFGGSGQPPASPIRSYADQAAPTTRFQILEIPLAIGHDYAIEDENGVEAFRVDGKLWHIPESMDVLDTAGKVIFTARGGVFDVKDSFYIARDGQDIATIRRANDTPATERFFIALPGGQEAQVVGDVRGYAYTIVFEGQTVATVSKPFLNLRANYVADVAPEQDAYVVVAITICLDRMVRS